MVSQKSSNYPAAPHLLRHRPAHVQADPQKPGYRHIFFRPQPVDAMESVTYTNNTPYGKAGISWNNTRNSFVMDITVPVGCRATVYVPAKYQHKKGQAFFVFFN